MPEDEIDARVRKDCARDAVDDPGARLLHVDLRGPHVRADHDVVAAAPRAADIRLPEVGQHLVEADDGALGVGEHLAVAVIRRHHDARVADEPFETAGRVEHVPERAIDAIDHRQRGVRADFVPAVVVVREVGDREIPERAAGREVTQPRGARRVVHAEAVKRSAGVQRALNQRRIGCDEVTQEQRLGPVDRFRDRHTGQHREQPRDVDPVARVAAKDEVVDTSGRPARALDHLEQRWGRQAVTVQPDEEVAEELAEPFLGDDPEVVAVVRDFFPDGVIPCSAGDAVLRRIRTRDDGTGRCRRDGRENRDRPLVHTAGIGHTLEVRKSARKNRGTYHPRRRRVDDDEEHLHQPRPLQCECLRRGASPSARRSASTPILLSSYLADSILSDSLWSSQDLVDRR